MVLHDLRRTFATKLAEMKVPPHNVEKLLNHEFGASRTRPAAGITEVARVDNLATYLPEMRSAIEDKWQPFLRKLFVC